MRTVILFTLILGLFVTASLIGTHQLSRKHKAIISEQATRLEYYKEELDRARDELQMQKRPAKQTSHGPIFSGTSFDNLYLKGITISSDSNAFQRTSFKAANLEDATLVGGVSSFQFACFDQASLKNAKLTGDGASFSISTFVDADLTGATLKGNFQKASFENANLTRATWNGSFQICNISGAQFAGAHLAEINQHDLESCYFSEAPTYNSKTEFPMGFNPEKQGWKRGDE